MEKIQKCDMCSNDFVRKYVAGRRAWSQINEVSYWTDNKEYKKYKILCRRCLKEWRVRCADDFIKLVSPNKKNRFRAYLYNNLFDKNDRVIRNR